MAEKKMAPRSLHLQAQSQIIRNIGLLTDATNVPLRLILPILRHVSNPKQLRALEMTSSELDGHTGELWLAFIKRDISGWETKLLRRRNGSMRDVELVKPKCNHRTYERLMELEKLEEENAEEMLRQAMRKHEAGQQSRETMIMRDVPSNFLKKRKSVFGRDTRSKTDPARGLIDRARRHAAEIRSFRKGPLSTPTHLLRQKPLPPTLVKDTSKPKLVPIKQLPAYNAQNDRPKPKQMPKQKPKPLLARSPPSDSAKLANTSKSSPPSAESDHSGQNQKRKSSEPLSSSTTPRPMKRKKIEPSVLLPMKRVR